MIYFDDNEIDSSECSWTLSESFDDTIDDQVFLSDNDSVEDLPLDDVRYEQDIFDTSNFLLTIVGSEVLSICYYLGDEDLRVLTLSASQLYSCMNSF